MKRNIKEPPKKPDNTTRQQAIDAVEQITRDRIETEIRNPPKIPNDHPVA